METRTLSTAMSICEKDPSCRKFYVTQSHIDDRSYYHYCGFHSQDAKFSLDQSTQYTLYTKKGKNHMTIGSIYYDSLYSINLYNTMKKTKFHYLQFWTIVKILRKILAKKGLIVGAIAPIPAKIMVSSKNYSACQNCKKYIIYLIKLI